MNNLLSMEHLSNEDIYELIQTACDKSESKPYHNSKGSLFLIYSSKIQLEQSVALK